MTRCAGIATIERLRPALPALSLDSCAADPRALGVAAEAAGGRGAAPLPVDVRVGVLVPQPTAGAAVVRALSGGGLDDTTIAAPDPKAGCRSLSPQPKG